MAISAYGARASSRKIRMENGDGHQTSGGTSGPACCLLHSSVLLTFEQAPPGYHPRPESTPDRFAARLQPAGCALSRCQPSSLVQHGLRRSLAANLAHRHGGVRSRPVGHSRFLWRFSSCVQGVRDAEAWVPGFNSASVTWEGCRAKFSFSLSPLQNSILRFYLWRAQCHT